MDLQRCAPLPASGTEIIAETDCRQSQRTTSASRRAQSTCTAYTLQNRSSLPRAPSPCALAFSHLHLSNIDLFYVTGCPAARPVRAARHRRQGQPLAVARRESQAGHRGAHAASEHHRLARPPQQRCARHPAQWTGRARQSRGPRGSREES